MTDVAMVEVVIKYSKKLGSGARDIKREKGVEVASLLIDAIM